MAVLVLALLGLGSTTGPGAGAQAPGPSEPSTAEQGLISEFDTVGGAPTVVIDEATDQISFVGASGPTAPSGPSGADLDGIASAFVEEHAAALGAGEAGNDLVRTAVNDSLAGGQAVTFQQTRNGIPVVGGEVKVVVDSTGAPTALAADVAPDLDLSTTPRVTAAAARAAAASSVAQAETGTESPSVASLTTSPATLAIYNNDVLGGPGDGRNHLVWQTEVTSTQAPFEYLVLVDAHRGSVAVSFDQVAEAKDRNVCDWNNTNNQPENSCVLAQYDRTELVGPSAVVDVEVTFDVSGDVYDFFSTRFGRDSYDGAGAAMIGNARYCPGTCPYANAFWNGEQIHLGTGWAAADDVVAHEWGHAYTEKTSNLYYYYESGAINEAYSDVWGELIDMTNGFGTDDAASRWLMGEDIPGVGAIRDAENPPAFNDPDRTQSALYYHATGDQGGVHTNSGVMNKAASLMVDGGTFNGVTVDPLGINKTAAVFWEAGATLLTSASDFQNLDVALVAACNTLIGGTAGITAADCVEVSDATDATEMHLNPIGHPTEAPVCAAGSTPATLFTDDFENTANGNWAATATGVGTYDTRFYWPQTSNPYFSQGWTGSYSTSGVTNVLGDPAGAVGDAQFAMTSDVAVPVGSPTFFRFNHAWDFVTFDAGVIEYSTDGGANWLDAGPLIDHNGYTGTIPGTSNPLIGRPAWLLRSYGMTSSRLNLTSLSGSNVRLRFRMATNASSFSNGWFIDDVDIYSCETPIDDIAIGSGHTCVASTAITECAGLNNYGQAQPPQAGIYSDLTAGAYYTCGIRTSDQGIDCWGLPAATTEPPGAFTSIEAGLAHTCAVRTDQAIVCWGSNPSGAGTPLAGTYTDVSASINHTCAVRTNQTIACWGANTWGKSTPPAGTFTKVATGREFSCGIRTNGTLACWGRNNAGQRVPPGGTFTQVTAGENMACALATSATAVNCWGSLGSPAGGSAIAEIESGQKGMCAIAGDRQSITCHGTVPPRP